ncbi:MAG: response regulator [Vicinamibacteria bacterium]
MGLQGQLQDMPFVDILQIVAFSQKTGYLHLDSPLGRGHVVFRNGMVVCACSWSTLDYVRRISAGHYEEGQKDTVILALVETSLREMARLQEGSFRFELTEEIGTELEGTDISAFVLERGINAQHLLLELTRELDEDRRETTARLESEFRTVGDLDTVEPKTLIDIPAEKRESERVNAGPLPPGVLDEPDPSRTQRVPASHGSLTDPLSTPLRHDGSTVIVVDDEEVVCEVLADELADNGYKVFTATDPAKASSIAEERVSEGEQVLVVGDFKMPTTTGKSFFGGFELARRLNAIEPPVPLLLMVEELSDKARRRALELGIRKVAFKPTLSKLDVGQYKTDLRAFGQVIIRSLAELAAHKAPPRNAEAVEPDSEQPSRSASELGESGASSPVLEFLAAMTEQLIDPHRSVDISRMALQVAEKFFERGVLFLVKNERASGLSGFGLAQSERENVSLAQQLSVSTEMPGPFQAVMARRKTQHLKAKLELLEPDIFSKIGRGNTNQAALVPMLNNAEVLLILYGDNGVSGQPLSPLTGLEVFMGQAGMALENVYLQSKLRSLDAKLTVGQTKD